MISTFQSWKKIRMIGSAAMAAVYVAAGKAESISRERNFSMGYCCWSSNCKCRRGKSINKQSSADYRVDANLLQQ